MTENLGPATSLARSEAGERLKAEIQEYLAVQAQRLLIGVGRKLGETTLKLNDIAEGKGPLRSALELGAARAKENVTEALRGFGGGKGRRRSRAGRKPTVIVEYVDVGVPLRTAYDQWTQIFWSSRSRKALTTEQVPDDRIAWTSEGAKGTTKGVVTFHRLADSLTRVLLVIEYSPKGLCEKTGTIWRARGRRARLDLKDYARYVTLRGGSEEEPEDAYEEDEAEGAYEDDNEVEAEEEEGEEEHESEPEDTYAGTGDRR